MWNQDQHVRLLLSILMSWEMICWAKWGLKMLNYKNWENITEIICWAKWGKQWGKLYLFSAKGAKKVVLNSVGGGHGPPPGSATALLVKKYQPYSNHSRLLCIICTVVGGRQRWIWLRRVELYLPGDSGSPFRQNTFGRWDLICISY